MMDDSESPLTAVDDATGDGSLFARLDEASRRAVEAEVEWVRIAGGSTLFRQGEAGDSLYVVIRGRLQAIVEVPAGPGRDRRDLARRDRRRDGGAHRRSAIGDDPRRA